MRYERGRSEHTDVIVVKSGILEGFFDGVDETFVRTRICFDRFLQGQVVVLVFKKVNGHLVVEEMIDGKVENT